MATCASELSGWAGQILDGIGETGVTTGRVVSWLQNNLYKLNISLGTGFYLDGSGCVQPDMNSFESGLYSEMYYCDYLNKKANEFLGAMAYNQIIEFEGQDQGKIKRVSKNEIAKTYKSMSSECQLRLRELIDWYKDDNNPYSPAYSINYSDRGSVTDWGLMSYCAPPTHMYSENNCIFNRSTITE